MALHRKSKRSKAKTTSSAARLGAIKELGSSLACRSQFAAAVRRLAYEASDTGLLRPELAAGILPTSTRRPPFFHFC